MPDLIDAMDWAVRCLDDHGMVKPYSRISDRKLQKQYM